ncbi:MAG: hypothetical protein LBR79_04195 [Oscillospiraceae bacterium]|nr:hypothetical protein [Oscillospiraceae bacterium]
MKKFLAMILSIFMILLNLSRCEGEKLLNPALTSDTAKTFFETDFSKSDFLPIELIKKLLLCCKKILIFQFKIIGFGILCGMEMHILMILLYYFFPETNYWFNDRNDQRIRVLTGNIRRDINETIMGIINEGGYSVVVPITLTNRREDGAQICEFSDGITVLRRGNTYYDIQINNPGVINNITEDIKEYARTHTPAAATHLFLITHEQLNYESIYYDFSQAVSLYTSFQSDALTTT